MAADTKAWITADAKAQVAADQSAGIRVRGISGHLRQAQCTIEYAVFIAVVAAALVAMQLYVRRAIQANLKTLEDRINADPVPAP